MQSIVEVVQSAAEHLTDLGWEALPEPNRWQLATPRGLALLEGQSLGSHWQSWSLTGPALDRQLPADPLRGNAALAWPGKWAGHSSGTLAWRLDLPQNLAEQEGDSSLASWPTWATALVQGAGPSPSSTAVPVEEVVAFLTKEGWSAAAADDAVEIKMIVPGIFRRVCIDCPAGRRRRVWTVLTELTGWPSLSRLAALDFARQANDRLRLVRLALVEGEAEHLVAEIDLEGPAFPGPWLKLTLEMVQAAIQVTTAALEALRGAELTQLYMQGLRA